MKIAIVTMPFEQETIISYSQIDDGSCVVVGKAELISRGWEEVAIDKNAHRLWRIDEFLNGKKGNQYWLDENRQIKRAHWTGAISYQVKTKEEALDSLPQATINSINLLFNSSSNSDWMNEINDWLSEAS